MSALDKYPCVKIQDATLYQGDCLDILPHLPNVDLVVTSPPYDDLRDYEGADATDPCDVLSVLAPRIREGGVCVWNVADAVQEGSETGSSFKQALHAKSLGLRIHDTMIYCKDGVPFPDNDRYMQAHEYMFVFANGQPKTCNLLRDRPNKYAGTVNHGTRRRKDGVLRKVGNGHVTPINGIRFNWWVINNNCPGVGHPAPMPYAMAHDHIYTWSAHRDVVLDPYTGSGTTGVACAKLGRKFIGIEIEPKYFDNACKRIEEAHAQPDMFIEQPSEPPKQTDMLEESA